ncbi:MAG: S-layer homology domain-containing protein [Anaerovoracaceae bacterium]
MYVQNKLKDSPSDWAKESVQWAVAKGLLQGKGTGLLAPRANAKRSECAAILQRFILSY